MLQKWIRIRSELIKTSSHQDSNNEINDSLSYKNCVTKLTKWMKEIDVITIYMQKKYATLEECRSALDFLQKLLNKRTTLDTDYTNVPSNREKMEWLPSNE